MDDIRIGFDDGWSVYLQAKRTLQKGRPFKGIVEQWAAAAPSLDPSRERLVAVSTQLSGPMRVLQRVLARAKVDMPGALSLGERKALDSLKALLPNQSPELLNVLLKSAMIVELAVEERSEAGAREARLLLERSVGEGDAGPAWSDLLAIAGEVARLRGGYAIGRWGELLENYDPTRRRLVGRPATSWSAVRLLPALPNGVVVRPELENLASSLVPSRAQVPVANLFGAPGIGKSILALALAWKVESRFPDGQFYINLRDGDRAVAAAEVLPVFLAFAGVDPDESLIARVGSSAAFRQVTTGRKVLLVLDNARNGAQVGPLMPGPGGSAVIVTSRMAISSPTTTSSTKVKLLPDDAALSVLEQVSGRSVDEDRVAASRVIELCGRLPLAVALAAAQLKRRSHWDLARLADALEDDHWRLDGVRASLQLSYSDLTESEREAFCLLGRVLTGEFTPDVAAGTLGVPRAVAHATLESLADQQLLEARTPGTFEFHDLVRLYAVERSSVDLEPDVVRFATDRHEIESSRDFFNSYKSALLAYTGVMRDVTSFGGQPLAADFDQLFVSVPWDRTPGSLETNEVGPTSPWSLDTQVNLRRIVVTGGPGSGKTTLATHAVREAARSRDLLPFHLAVRQLVADGYVGIPEAIARIASAQLHLSVRTETVRRALSGPDALVVLDGLDEALTAERKEWIGSAIDDLLREFPAVMVLVTTRETGMGAVLDLLDSLGFASFELGRLQGSAVPEFVQRWASARDLGVDFDEQFAREVVVQSDTMRSLLATPLFLATMLEQYRTSHSLPSSRVDLMERAVELLLSRWDQIRGIRPRLTLPGLDRALLESVALQMEIERKASVVSANDLRVMLLAAGAERLGTRENVEDAVGELLSDVRGRGGILAEVGVDRSGEPLFSFAHLSMRNYLAASQLAKSSHGMLELLERLEPLAGEERLHDVLVLSILVMIRRHRQTNELERLQRRTWSPSLRKVLRAVADEAPSVT